MNTFQNTINLQAIQEILNEVKLGLESIFTKRLNKIILFGSYARNDSTVESDIDLMVILDSIIDIRADKNNSNEIVFPLSLKHDKLISIVLISEETFNQANSTLLMNIQKEGISI